LYLYGRRHTSLRRGERSEEEVALGALFVPSSVGEGFPNYSVMALQGARVRVVAESTK
jgi:hypothetical protein